VPGVETLGAATVVRNRRGLQCPVGDPSPAGRTDCRRPLAPCIEWLWTRVAHQDRREAPALSRWVHDLQVIPWVFSLDSATSCFLVAGVALTAPFRRGQARFFRARGARCHFLPWRPRLWPWKVARDTLHLRHSLRLPGGAGRSVEVRCMRPPRAICLCRLCSRSRRRLAKSCDSHL
jgi:hypothetical protein